MKGLIIVPAYNEESSIYSVLEKIKRTCSEEDLIVIDDGSRDRTAEIVRQAGVACVSHPVNLGYVRGLQTGIFLADERHYDYLVFLDADGQHDPHDIAALKACAFGPERPDIVIGSRFISDKHYQAPMGRRLGMMLFSVLTRWFGGRRIYDTTSGFKLLRRRAFQLVSGQVLGDFHAEMIIFGLVAGLRIQEVPVVVSERTSGTSMYSWLQALLYPVKTILAILVLWPEARRGRRVANT